MTHDLLIAHRASFESDEQAMAQAMQLAKQAYADEEVPVGAVVIYRRALIGWGKNSPIRHHDPTAHAEMQALRMASQHLQNYRLPECELFVTLEPCCMCVGAIIHARIRRLVFAALDPKTGACGSAINLLAESRINHHCRAESGLMAEESGQLLRQFFSERRKGMAKAGEGIRAR